MFRYSVPLILLALVAAPFVHGAKLTITLEPALDWNDAVGETELLYFNVISPVGEKKCQDVCLEDFSSKEVHPCEDPNNMLDNENPINCHWYVPDMDIPDVAVSASEFSGDCFTECSGEIPFNLSEFDELEFVFRAPAGKEVKITPDSPDRDDVEFELRLEATCDDSFSGYQSFDGPSFDIVIFGSETDDIENGWVASDSFVDVGKCPGCGTCEIFTRMTTTGSGSIQALGWSVPLDGSKVAGIGNQSWMYHTEGYSWLRTSPDGAIVDAPDGAIVDEAPAPTPSANPPGSSSGSGFAPGFKDLLGLSAIAVTAHYFVIV